MKHASILILALAALLMVAGCNNSSNTNTKDMANNEPLHR